MRGKLLAERGQGSAADVAYARAAELAAGRLDPFLEAGWWIAGPYTEDMTQPQPPEFDPDPSRAVAGESRTPLRWKPAAVNQDRFISLATVRRPGGVVGLRAHTSFLGSRAHGAALPQRSANVFTSG